MCVLQALRQLQEKHGPRDIDLVLADPSSNKFQVELETLKACGALVVKSKGSDRY